VISTTTSSAARAVNTSSEICGRCHICDTCGAKGGKPI
jgi:hypothetical protein